jgi:hypothetical protein
MRNSSSFDASARVPLSVHLRQCKRLCPEQNVRSINPALGQAHTMTPPPPICETPREPRALGQALPNFADALCRLKAVDIVTVGSSSTEGDGASSPDSSYPSRLNVALSSRFPDRTIKLINAGVGRQEAPDEAARFKNDVLANNPSLVIWQVGTASAALASSRSLRAA